jgi:hypothetical protein
MRRWLTAMALAGVAGLLMSACGNPAGVDGSLPDDWAPLAEPTAFTPPAGVCHPGAFRATAPLSLFNPVDCGASHKSETVYVGTFTGASAARSTPPAPGSPDLRPAFAECDAKAAGFLGGDWRTGRLSLGVAVPSGGAWAGGSRWFRCDLDELSTVQGLLEANTRTASLRAALTGPSPLHLGCLATRLAKDGTIESMRAVECGDAHNTEFVGVWKAPDIPYPSKDADWARLHTECRRLVAKYAGVPDDGKLRYRTGVVSLPGSPEEWRAGNRGVRCYLWLSDRTLTRSLRNGGTGALPIKIR